jgi:hypothetical protein
MKACGEVDVYIHIFLTPVLVGGEWSASRPSRLNLWERAPGTHWIGGLVDPRTGLGDVAMTLERTSIFIKCYKLISLSEVTDTIFCDISKVYSTVLASLTK